MTRQEKADQVKNFLDDRFGLVDCFLKHKTEQEFLIAVILSAQSNDKSVNKVTPILFDKYKDLASLSKANVDDVISIIKPVGLAKTKASHIIEASKILVDKYDGQIPKDREVLMTLPGVGFKTSGVVLGELYNFPYLPVDTHVERVSKFLGLVDKDLRPEQIELKLEKLFKNSCLINTHRQLIMLGRTILTAKNPKLDELPFSWIKKS